ncbi:MAG: NUDIX domain-containing protein [Treponema sp.]|nr:NUDIX domain-containing protein [Candidatus Treponema merdequi]
MSNEFIFCPICQSRKIQYQKNIKWFCPNCGFDLYNNVAAAVGLIIIDTDKTVIFERRAKDPQKGKLAIPGGFIDQDESAEQAAFRECLEETGIKPDSVKYVASFPNTYPYKNITYKTCDFFFIADFSKTRIETKIVDLMKGQKSEVLNFESIKITDAEQINNLDIAFESTRNALLYWFENFQNNGVN